MRAADSPAMPIAASPSSEKALSLARTYAIASCFIVLTGDTGTGKSRLAQWIHDQGRAGKPFEEVTSAELSDSLAHSDLFGHDKGAFTGSACKRRGLFERAGDGTVLLDDFHLCPLSIQAMLLRTLSSGRFRPLGSERDVPLRCRVIFGLRKSPDQLLAENVLRPDLRYRLGYCEIRLTPLSERREEIGPLAKAFVHEFRLLNGSGPKALAPDVVPALESAPWPGNVRELRAVVEASCIHAQGDEFLRFDHLPDHVRISPRFRPHGDAALNQRAIEWALWRTDGHTDLAAQLLGVHRNTISAYRARKASESPAHISAPTTVHTEPISLS